MYSTISTKSPSGDKPLILSLDKLNIFKNQLTVDQNKLIKEGLIDAKEAKRMGVKVLANGELKRALKVALPVSAGAKKAIEEAGGEVVESQ